MKLEMGIIGVGAMACLFAARLNGSGTSAANEQSAPPPFPVTLYGTFLPQIEALRGNGLQITSAAGRRRLVSIPVHTYEQPGPSLDVAVVLVKSYQTVAAARFLRERLKPSGVAVTLQNGLGNLPVLSQILGVSRVTAGTTAQAALITSAGCVTHSGGGKTWIGRLPERAELLQILCSRLQQAGLPCGMSDNIDGLLWSKLCINCAINPLSALTGLSNGELLQDSRIERLMISAAQEVAALAHAKGITLNGLQPQPAVRAVCEATAANRSSMLQDVLNRRPTEIEALCGAVIREAERFSLPVPVNRFLYREVMAKSTRADYCFNLEAALAAQFNSENVA